MPAIGVMPAEPLGGVDRPERRPEARSWASKGFSVVGRAGVACCTGGVESYELL